MGGDRVPDAWEAGPAYERYVGRWSRRVAPRFLDWLDPRDGLRWLDVGCGTGALSAAIVERGAPRSVDGADPSPGFLESATAELGSRVTFHLAEAAALPFDDRSVDVVVSGLMLNFVPDAAAALTEMRRVAAGEGLVAAYVWDYAGRMEMMRRFWDAAAEVDPAAARFDEATRFPICTPAGLEEAFEAAGFRDVVTGSIEIPTRFADFDDFWAPFLGGQGAAPAYAMSLGAAQRGRIRDALDRRSPRDPDGGISMVARAWTVRGLAVG